MKHSSRALSAAGLSLVMLVAGNPRPATPWGSVAPAVPTRHPLDGHHRM